MWDDCEGIGRLRDGREVLRTKEGTRHAQERKTIVRRVKAGLAARKAKGLRVWAASHSQCVSYGSRFSSFLLTNHATGAPSAM